MKLLNSKSIIDCDENEELLHSMEIENIFNSINQYDDYECAVLKKYQDFAHKDKEMEVLSCNLKEIADLLSVFDTKNGIDVLIDDEGFYVFVLYGQSYVTQSGNSLVTVALKVMPYDKNRNFINLFELN